ncbi:uncharacterized protein LOC120668041 [Panicum virgatum]|uniref:uncharacterized protein LOC120668041 n=1 Tax=Panicum virgatum TaxID=38727 RepID=UPI0019D65918|nr:uncharacterized protein LOC120668041 [Panicum virgatum]
MTMLCHIWTSTSKFDNEGKTMLFDERGHMTHIFEKLIIEYFDMFESLLKQNLILEKFDIDNMFVNIFDRVPTLRVLLTEVTKVPFIGVLNRKLAWDCPPFIGVLNRKLAWDCPRSSYHGVRINAIGQGIVSQKKL